MSCLDADACAGRSESSSALAGRLGAGVAVAVAVRAWPWPCPWARAWPSTSAVGVSVGVCVCVGVCVGACVGVSVGAAVGVSVGRLRRRLRGGLRWPSERPWRLRRPWATTAADGRRRRIVRGRGHAEHGREDGGAANAVARMRRVTSLRMSAPQGARLSRGGGVVTRSRPCLTLDLSLRSCVGRYALRACRTSPRSTSASPGPTTPARLAGTTRLGFESYRDWAPDGWRPPPRALELRAIRERLKQNDAPGARWRSTRRRARRATSASPTRAERDRPHVRIPGRAHLWMLFLRPRWWGTGLAARLHRLALEEAARQGYETIRLYTPQGQARARAFYAREGWVPAGPPFAEPLLGLDLRGVPPRPRLTASEAQARRSRRRPSARACPCARAGSACGWPGARWCRRRWPSRSPGRLAKRVWGHPAPFFAPVAAIIALGQSYQRARAAGGRDRHRRLAGDRGGRRAGRRARHGRRRSWRSPCSSPSASACSSARASCSSTRWRSPPCWCSRSPPRTGSRSPARSTR